MPNWKKVIVSGSDASLNSLNVVNGITGSLFGTASYASNGGVTQLLAGPNVTLSPTNGLGQVTVSSTSGGGGFNTATGSYGSFYDTTTQTNPVANTPRSMSLNTTDITNGVSVSGSTNPFNTYIKTENAGVYNIQFSAQVDKTDAGNDEIIIWLRKNGTNLADTATTLTLSGNNDKQVAAWNWFVNSAANDYYQIIWYSADTDLRLLAEATGGGHPGIPSVIVTANRIDQFLSNTGSFSGSFTGPLTGTASYASQALNASTASYVLQAVSSSYASNADLLDGLNSTVFATTGSNTFTGAQIISSSLTVFSGSAVDFQVTEIGTKIGNLITDIHTVTGSTNISGSSIINGSLAVGNITPSATVGRIDASNDVVAFSTSDIRLKTNILPIENPLEKISQIGGYTFDWNSDPELTKLHGFEGHDIGVIAQEIEKVLPEVVTTRDNGYKAVKYEKLVALLIESNKELLKRIEVLESKINQ